jgi:hypothetical protein
MDFKARKRWIYRQWKRRASIPCYCAYFSGGPSTISVVHGIPLNGLWDLREQLSSTQVQPVFGHESFGHRTNDEQQVISSAVNSGPRRRGGVDRYTSKITITGRRQNQATAYAQIRVLPIVTHHHSFHDGGG